MLNLKDELSKLQVGDTVVIRNVNERHIFGDLPVSGTVVKITRKNVYVQAGNGKPMAYSIVDGIHNDAYRHISIQTEAYYQQELAKKNLEKKLNKYGVSICGSDLSPDQTAALRCGIGELLDKICGKDTKK